MTDNTTNDAANATLPAMEYAAPGERSVARKLVRAALAQCYVLSVYDGEEWTVQRSADAAAILAALATTDEDTLRIRRADGTSAGLIMLVWGNDPDGSELIADHTDNDDCRDIVAYAEGRATLAHPAWYGEA